jgi:hypothetical protein
MADIQTHSQGQRHAAEEFVAAYAAVNGDSFADDLVILAKANHRFYVTYPGDESVTEYSFGTLKAEVEQLRSQVAANVKPDTKPSPTDALAALAEGAGDKGEGAAVAESPTVGVPADGQEGEVEDGISVDGGSDRDDGGDDSDSDSGQANAVVRGEAALEDMDDADSGSAADDGDAVVEGGDDGSDGSDDPAGSVGSDDGGDPAVDGAATDEAGDEDGQAQDGAATDADSSDGAAGTGSDSADEPSDGDDPEDVDEDADPETGELPLSEEELTELMGDGESDEAEKNKSPDEGEQAEGEEEQVGDSPTEEKKKGKGRKLSKPKVGSSAAANLIAQMLKNSDGGNTSRFALATDLYDLDVICKEEGLNVNEALEKAKGFFEAKGRKFPDKTTRSKMKTVYRTFCVDAGYDPEQVFTSTDLTNSDGNPKTSSPDSDELIEMQLNVHDIYALYPVRGLIEPGADEHNCSVMALVNTLSYKAIQRVAPHLDKESAVKMLRKWNKLPEDKRDDAAIAWAAGKKGSATSEFKSITVETPIYNNFMAVLEDMNDAAIEGGVFEPEKDNQKISKTFVLENLLEMWQNLQPRQKLLFLKHANGGLEEDEYAELQGNPVDLTVTVEGVPADLIQLKEA